MKSHLEKLASSSNTDGRTAFIGGDNVIMHKKN